MPSRTTLCQPRFTLTLRAETESIPGGVLAETQCPRAQHPDSALPAIDCVPSAGTFYFPDTP